MRIILNDSLKTINDFLIRHYDVDMFRNCTTNTNFSNSNLKSFFEEVDKFLCYNGSLNNFVLEYYGSKPKIQNIPINMVNSTLYYLLFDFDGKPLYKKGITPTITSDHLGYTDNQEIIFIDGDEKVVIGGNRKKKTIYNKDVKRKFEDVLGFDVKYIPRHYETFFSYEEYNSYEEARADISVLTRHDAACLPSKDYHEWNEEVCDTVSFQDNGTYNYKFKKIDDTPDFCYNANVHVDIRNYKVISCDDNDMWFSEDFLAGLRNAFVKKLNDNEEYLCKIFYNLFSEELSSFFTNPKYKFKELLNSYRCEEIMKTRFCGVDRAFREGIDDIRLLEGDVFRNEDNLNKKIVNARKKMHDMALSGIQIYERGVKDYMLNSEEDAFIKDVINVCDDYLKSSYIKKVSLENLDYKYVPIFLEVSKRFCFQNRYMDNGKYKVSLNDIIMDSISYISNEKDLLASIIRLLICDDYNFVLLFNEAYVKFLKREVEGMALGLNLNECPDGFDYSINMSMNKLIYAIKNMDRLKDFDEFMSYFDELKMDIINFKNYMEDCVGLEHNDSFDSKYILDISKKFEEFALGDLDSETGDSTGIYNYYFIDSCHFSYIGGDEFIPFKAQLFAESFEGKFDMIEQICNFNYIKESTDGWEKESHDCQIKTKLLKWYGSFIKMFDEYGFQNIICDNNELIVILDSIRDKYQFVHYDSFISNMIYLNSILEKENSICNISNQNVLVKTREKN